jgi:two-component sensor histidine kinase
MKRSLLFLLIAGTLLVHCAQAQSETKVNGLKRRIQLSKPDTNRANLLLELARIYLFKPDEQAGDLDTTLRLVRQAYAISQYFHYPKGLGNAYLVGAQAYREKGDAKQGRKFAQTALNIFTRIPAMAEKAEAYLEISRTYSISPEELPFRIQNHEKALSIFQQIGNKEREAVTLRELGEFEDLRKSETKALVYLNQSLAVSQAIGYRHLQGVYCLLGQVSSKLGDFKSGVNYGLLALKTAEAVKDTSMQLCTIYNQLGITYHLASDKKAAVSCFENALRIAQRYNDTQSIWQLTLNLTIISRDYVQIIRLLKSLEKRLPAPDLEFQFIIYSRLVKSYHTLHQYKLAQLYCDRFEKLKQESGYSDQAKLVTQYNSLILFYIDTHQHIKAKSLLVDLTENSKRTNYKSLQVLSHTLWYKLDSAQGNFRSALAYHQRYSKLKDSLFTEKKNKEISRLQVEFETSKKEQQLQLKEKNIQLLTNRNRVQQATLERNALQRNSIMGGAIMLLLLLGLTYNRYRLKQRSNQQLEAKQVLIDQKNQALQQVVGEKDDLLEEKEELLEEREWMLKEIHHRVKNNLQVISSMLHSQVEFLHDPTALATIRESQNRVQVMALIHQKLYQIRQPGPDWDAGLYSPDCRLPHRIL